MAPDPDPRPRRSIWRRLERRFVGLGMSVIVWFAERRLMKAAKRTRS